MSPMGDTIRPMSGDASDPALTGVIGVEEQLAFFFDAHYFRMVGLAGLVCRNGALAEDAVQAAMEQAWKRRASLRDPDRLRAWIDRIVVREAIRIGRRPWWSRLTGATANDEARLLADHSSEVTPERLALAEAFDALTAEQRAACVLHLHLGYAVAETAEIMGAGVETTRSRLRLARRRLRAELTEVER
jgi:RNA polymerase sigma factor (sigma-70 family)